MEKAASPSGFFCVRTHAARRIVARKPVAHESPPPEGVSHGRPSPGVCRLSTRFRFRFVRLSRRALVSDERVRRSAVCGTNAPGRRSERQGPPKTNVSRETSGCLPCPFVFASETCISCAPSDFPAVSPLCFGRLQQEVSMVGFGGMLSVNHQVGRGSVL